MGRPELQEKLCSHHQAVSHRLATSRTQRPVKKQGLRPVAGLRLGSAHSATQGEIRLGVVGRPQRTLASSLQGANKAGEETQLFIPLKFGPVAVKKGHRRRWHCCRRKTIVSTVAHPRGRSSSNSTGTQCRLDLLPRPWNTNFDTHSLVHLDDWVMCPKSRPFSSSGLAAVARPTKGGHGSAARPDQFVRICLHFIPQMVA